MSIEENRVIVQRIFNEAANNRQFEVIDELFSDDNVSHQVNGADLNGPGGVDGHFKTSHLWALQNQPPVASK